MTPDLKNQLDYIISLMPDTFDSHQFILKLAELNQAEYIRSLHTYVNSDAPFRALHAQLAKALKRHPHLTQIGVQDSPNIFNVVGENALWRK